MNSENSQQPFIINVKEDGIEINEHYFPLPLNFADLKKQLGDRYEQWKETDTNTVYRWNDLGIQLYIPKNEHGRIEISIKTADIDESFLPDNRFMGELRIKGQNYLDFFSNTQVHQSSKDIEMENLKISASVSENESQNIEEISISEIVKEEKIRIQSDPYRPNTISGEKILFTDFNFKLAVIEELMYTQELIQPKFDIFEFADHYQQRQINTDEEGYSPIPEAMEYFKNLEIDKTLAGQVTQIYQDGGNDIYMNIIPYWDGEDDFFNIEVYDDIKHFPNLKKMTLFSNDPKVYEELQLKGIDAVPL
ncbi:MAG: hypothetical protein LBE92_17150 [Chryseobacterium sp.]|jgi:hypothetical protein|uniref:DUF6892 domain-containing protein n=1 Tax=Chryseobacterium sp. TaxID=1871047 RepID=UPI002834EBEB|nr:hypothetical protein [Chryseobacterium sp.]MDR2237853.1 hypothetical protein [Chryseobacterium sp.]